METLILRASWIDMMSIHSSNTISTTKNRLKDIDLVLRPPLYSKQYINSLVLPLEPPDFCVIQSISFVDHTPPMKSSRLRKSSLESIPKKSASLVRCSRSFYTPNIFIVWKELILIVYACPHCIGFRNSGSSYGRPSNFNVTTFAYGLYHMLV